MVSFQRANIVKRTQYLSFYSKPLIKADYNEKVADDMHPPLGYSSLYNVSRLPTIIGGHRLLFESILTEASAFDAQVFHV